jgi:hypothetical protein
MTARARRITITALALLGAALPVAAASAQVPPPLPEGPALPSTPLLTPFPETLGPTLQQLDCRSYWIRSAEPPHRVESQTVCFGWRIVP